MRILICDDNPQMVEKLKNYLLEYFGNNSKFEPEFAIYGSGDQLLEKEKNADIAFLDVEMPGISGIHVGAKLKEYNPYVKIFIVTSHPDYLDEAMRYKVFRYLSKPIDKARLFRNLKDALYQYAMDTKEYVIQSDKGLIVKRSDEIICVEARHRKRVIHTTSETFISYETMDYWKEKLSMPCFNVTHRCYIVNMRFVAEIHKDSILLRYKEREIIAYLSKRKFVEFKDTFLLYQESVK